VLGEKGTTVVEKRGLEGKKENAELHWKKKKEKKKKGRKNWSGRERKNRPNCFEARKGKGRGDQAYQKEKKGRGQKSAKPKRGGLWEGTSCRP